MSPVPKSLHTVTVLVAMARLILDNKPHYTPYDAVYAAIQSLGYAAEADHYSLAQQAFKKLLKVTPQFKNSL